jgi:hypothetical protein
MPQTPPKRPLVIGIVGENANGCLIAATKGLNEHFSHYGIEGHCINLREPNWSEALASLLADRTPHFCYGFAGIGASLRNGDESFWTTHKTPFLSLMYDHPFCNLANHTVASAYVANCYFIGDFLEAQLNFVKHPGENYLLRDAFGHSAPMRTSPDPAVRRSDWRKRSIPYLFIKTGYDLSRHNGAIISLTRREKGIFHDCLDVLQHSADHNLTLLAAEHCRQKQIDLDTGHGSFSKIVLLLERYVRDWRGVQIVEWLKHKPALIVGDGWDFIDKTGASATFRASIPATECDQLYRDSRFVLNANPCFRDGYHERIICGLQSGAIAVSDRNRFSDHVFAKLENFVSFDWADARWRENLDTRLTQIETDGGDFDPTIAYRHMNLEFPNDPFVAKCLMIAQKIRQSA